MKRLLMWTLGTPARATASAAVLIALLVVALVVVPPLQLIALTLVVGSPIGAVVKAYPNEAKQFVGRILGRAAWISASVEREAIRQDVEGTLRAGINKSLSPELGVSARSFRIEFIRSGEEVSNLPDGTLIVGVTHHRERTRNLVVTAWAYARHGVIPEARVHLDSAVSRGIDFVVTKEILSRADREAVSRFVTEIWLPTIESDDKLRRLTERIDALQDDGLFAPIILTEFRDLGARLAGRLPTQGVAEETAAFVDFLYDLRGLAQGQLGETEFTGQAIRCKLIMVARPDVYAMKGTGPYRKAVEYSMLKGFRTIYLLARGRHSEYAEEVAAAYASDPRILKIWSSHSTITTAAGSLLVRTVTRIDVDVHLYTGIGQRPIVATGPGLRSGVASDGRRASKRHR